MMSQAIPAMMASPATPPTTPPTIAPTGVDDDSDSDSVPVPVGLGADDAVDPGSCDSEALVT